MEYTKNIDKALKGLEKGAFLTVKNGDKVNTMTIGWGQIGYQWKKPVFTVMVRKSRYTYELLENAKEFTVSIPVEENEELKNALKVCGTKSGRECDKIKECKLKLEDGKSIKTPIIANCELQYECRILCKHELVSEELNEEIDSAMYSNNDYHVFYYGEIVNTYEK